MILRAQFLILFNLIFMAKGVFKFTNVKCIEYDKSFATIPVCRLRIVRRGVVGLNLNVTLHKLPVTNVSINFSLLKKANGYRPFLYNASGNFCQIMKRKNELSFLVVVLRLMATSSNINHTCPYNHDIIVRDLSLNSEMFKLLPLPGGDYLCNIRVAAYNDWKACVQIYFSVQE